MTSSVRVETGWMGEWMGVWMNHAINEETDNMKKLT